MARRLGEPRHGALPVSLLEEILHPRPGPRGMEPVQATGQQRQELDQGQGKQHQHAPRSGQGRPRARKFRSGVPLEQPVEHREEAPVLDPGGRELAHRLRGHRMSQKTQRLTALFILLIAAPLAWAQNPRVEFKTGMGAFTLELYPDKAPKTVANFLQYAKSGFYDGTIFHRVIDGFMIQGGGFQPDMRQKPTQGTIKNEAGNGLKNENGTIAMARTPDPHSATAQFFINVKDNGFLDYRDSSPQGYGYAVFGRVVEGMDTVMRISKVPTAASGQHGNVPQKPVVIESVKLKPAK